MSYLKLTKNSSKLLLQDMKIILSLLSFIILFFTGCLMDDDNTATTTATTTLASQNVQTASVNSECC